MNNIFKSLYVCFVVFLHSGNALGYMCSKVVNLNSGTNLVADGEFIGKEEIIMSCGETFSGHGSLGAPIISITAKNFEFTGTIKCDVKCTITVGKSFNDKMFKRQGKGKFIIKVDPNLSSSSSAIEPRVINICGADFTLKGQRAIEFADAIEKDDIERVKEIIEDNPNLKNNKDLLSFFMVIAGYYNHMNIVRELIRLGADINSENINPGGQRPLLFAIGLKNVDFVRVLVQAGADPNKSNRMSMRPLLRYAVGEGDVNCLIELLKAKKIAIDERYNKDGATVLMCAANLGYKEMVEALLEAGADPSIQDLWNHANAIDYAAAGGHKDIVELIKQRKSICSKKKDDIANKKETGKLSEEDVEHKETSPSIDALDTKDDMCEKKDNDEIVENKTSEEPSLGEGKCEIKISEGNKRIQQIKSWISKIKLYHVPMLIPIIFCGYIFLRDISR